MATSTTPKVYEHIGAIFIELASILKPAERLTVSQAAEKYRRLNNPGAYVGPWFNSAVCPMVEPMDTFTSREHNGMIFVGSAQSGKALAINTPIAVPSGWKQMGDLRIGDHVFDDQGKVCRVTLITPTMHDHPCYRITFDDRTTIVADAEHRWVAYDDCEERIRTLETSEIAATFKFGARNRYAIQNAKAIELPDLELPIDPYVLGVWLGDGHVCIGEGDAAGYPVDLVKIDPTHGRRVSGSFRDVLHTPECFPGKFIPPQYQRASIAQRRALLQGMNDTDGTISARGVVTFSSSVAGLADDYRMLCASLGIKTSLSVKSPQYTYKDDLKKGKPSYSVSSMPRESDRPFRLKRHLARVNGDDQGRRIINVERVESVPVCCIQVDSPSHLYLAGRQMVPTHNTDSLVLNTLAYCVKVDPMDMMLVCPTNTDGRDFSIRRIDRLHRHSPAIGAMMLPGADADNKFDKQYSNGMLFTIGWPTPSQLAGKPIGRIVLTDRDRMPDDVDGDGEPFDLASKRTTTFGSYAMTVAESSPSRPVTDLKWIPRTPHEAPPCEGILKLYNRGDRRRWYWPCPECNRYFEGEFKMVQWDTEMAGSNLDRAATARMCCPFCAYKIHPDERDGMQQWGIWLKEGQAIDELGRVFGPVPRTSIASFWLKGVAAAFANWRGLVNSYLVAEDEYGRTGSEEALKKFYNNDLGEPYYPKSMTDDLRSPEVLKAREEKSLGERVVPAGVRFLVATCDVQKNMWVVQVFGILPGVRFDTVLIDRFDVRKSKRTDGDGERIWVKPHAYLEDWDELTENVIEKQYPLGDDSGRMMGIRFVGCDSGGRAGVTTMAYDYYRRLRDQNKHRRFILVKGDPLPNIPRARISYPDSSRRDQKSAARGDVPVLMLNSNALKDDLSGRLDCIQPGQGMFRTPAWLSDSFYAELCAEIRTPKGWANTTSARNEATDLSYYCIGICISELLSAERLDWNSPPLWAAEWDINALVSKIELGPRFAPSIESEYDFAQFGKALA